jgi:hypothetical protein
MEMFEGMAARIKDTGKIVMPAGNGTVSTTALRDVGEVVVDVLTKPGHENKSYDLTGPELLTFAQIADQFSTILGRTIEYVDQPMDEFRAVLKKIGFSGKVVEFHKFGGMINFVDSVARHENLIILFDGYKKGKHFTRKTIHLLQRRTNVDLTFKRKLTSITKGKIRFIEQLVCYESFIV